MQHLPKITNGTIITYLGQIGVTTETEGPTIKALVGTPCNHRELTIIRNDAKRADLDDLTDQQKNDAIGLLQYVLKEVLQGQMAF